VHIPLAAYDKVYIPLLQESYMVEEKLHQRYPHKEPILLLGLAEFRDIQNILYIHLGTR